MFFQALIIKKKYIIFCNIIKLNKKKYQVILKMHNIIAHKRQVISININTIHIKTRNLEENNFFILAENFKKFKQNIEFFQ